MCFGGYPKVVLASNSTLKKEYLKQIYTTYIEKDIRDIGKIKELNKFNNMLKLLASQVWSLVNVSEFSNTLNIEQRTFNERVFLLDNTFVIKIISPFSTNMRWELTKMPKIYFVDNGIRNFCIDDFEITGNSFENSFFNHINNSYYGEHINFYRTQDKKEIDFVIDRIPYELKLSYNGKSLTALDYFYEKYNKTGTVITLTKSSNDKYTILYPWELENKKT
jgi:predicted AAA+ superfamily ATPase